ncbi:MAG: histidine phosphatase family protein [Eubacterium sp.]|nr:histidine phosphatase family protein [Eubacterium sp.]
MTIYLLRHGETTINTIGGRFQGQINTQEAALNSRGREQAREAGEEFRRRGIHFDLVYSSPQERAVETAMLATGKSAGQIILDDRLKELNFGPYEGQKWEKMDPRKFDTMMHDFGNYMPGPGLESSMQLMQRVCSFLEELKRNRPAESILVSTHGGTIRAALVHIHADPMKTFWQNPVGNCAWFALQCERDRFILTDCDRKE